MDTEILETLDIMFSAILIGGAKGDVREQKEQVYVECMKKFSNQFQYNIFSKEYALIYDILKKLNIKVFSAEQLSLIIDNNLDLITESPLVDIAHWDEINLGNQLNQEEKILLFKQLVLQKFNTLCNRVVTIDEFDSSVRLFIDYYRETESYKTAQNMTLINKEGIKLRTLGSNKWKLYKGSKGRDDYHAEQKKVLDSLLGTQGIQSVVLNDEWLQKQLELEEKGEAEGLLTTNLPPIDDVTGPLRRSNVLGILGPPKGGKTKYANYLTALALEKGLNVTVWVLEGTQDEWSAMQQAAYIRLHKGDSLNSNDILNRRYADNITKQQVMAAKVAIATGKGRGKLSFIEGTAYIENFVDTILTHYRCENQFDVLVIDSLVNIQSLTGCSKVDRISEGFMSAKDLVAHKLPKPALGILTAQLKQSTIDWLRSHPDETMDVTAGGESAETIRTPDIIHGLFSSKDERKENKTHFYCVGSRHSEAFDDFVAKCELNCAYFEYDPSEDF
jgi:hypothetical protein